jgi:hypothetical protein
MEGGLPSPSYSSGSSSPPHPSYGPRSEGEPNAQACSGVGGVDRVVELLQGEGESRAHWVKVEHGGCPSNWKSPAAA